MSCLSCSTVVPSPVIMIDPEIEIMNSVVYCIHHKEGCKWSDQLRKLKAHLNTCKYDTIACTACSAQIPRLLMDDHTQTTCPNRERKCHICGIKPINNSHDCSQEPIYCDNKCGGRIPRSSLNIHKLTTCSKRLLSCRWCRNNFVSDTLTKHEKKCPRAKVLCPNHCSASPQIMREDLETHLALCKPAICCPFTDAGCKYKAKSNVELDKHIDDKMSQHLALMCNVVLKQQNQIVKIKQALVTSTTNYSGTLVWKISNVNLKREEAKCKDGVELLSPSWYTSQFGYKLQASVFLNGNGNGENTHLSVYIKLLPGDYDPLLTWPFSHTVEFTLFDQSEKPCNIAESFVPDPTWQNFIRPSKEPDSLGFGFPRFIALELLNKRNYIKDDMLFIRIKVDPHKTIAV